MCTLIHILWYIPLFVGMQAYVNYLSNLIALFIFPYFRFLEFIRIYFFQLGTEWTTKHIQGLSLSATSMVLWSG